MSVSLYLLGPFKAQLEAAAEAPALRRKTRALLAYLAATATPHNRRTLATMFCQEAKDPAAVLRSLLSRIRRGLHRDILLTDGDTVCFDAATGWVDCHHFEQTLAADLGAQTVEALQTAVDLYRGEFLEGIDLEGAPEFDLWLLGRRAHMRRLYQRGLNEIIARLSEQKAYSAAIARAQQLLQGAPLLEEAHARLIWLYAQSGQREAALRQYEQCRQLLQQELAVEPMPELQALYADLLAGQPQREFKADFAPPAAAESDRQTTDFVGRQAELDQLQCIWQEVERGAGAVVLVEAEAGGGKTRLVQEFGKQVAAEQFLMGRCYESAVALPYYPWMELLEAHLAGLEDSQLRQLSSFTIDYLGRLLPGLARRLARKLAPLLPMTGGEMVRLFTAVFEFLLLPASRPRVLFIDDLQWADETSLRLYHFIARRVPQTPLLLVGAFRPEEAGDTPALQTLLEDLRRDPLQRLQLAPLTPVTIDALASHMWPKLPQGYRSHVVAMLAQATGGNALFVTEVLRELAHTTRVPATLPISAGIRDLIDGRLRRLPESSRQVIEAVAVLNGPITLDQAQQISARGEEETATAIDLGLQRGLLQPESGGYTLRYDFHHDLVRQVTVDRLTPVRRQRLHHRAALALEQAGSRAATLVYHWGMARNRAKEGTYAVMAGKEAAAVYANEEAIRYYQRALELLAIPAKRAEVGCELGDVWLLIGEWTAAEEVYRHALAEAIESNRLRLQARCRTALGKLLSLRGQYEAALACLQQALQEHQAAGNKEGLTVALNSMAVVHYRQSEYDEAMDCYQRALQIDRELGNKEGISIRIGNMGLIHWDQGAYDKALACLEESLQIYQELDHKAGIANRTGNIGLIYSQRGQYGRAVEHYLRALHLEEELGNKAGIARHIGNMGVDYFLAGAYQEALACFKRALQLDWEMGNKEGVFRHTGNMASVYMRMGRYEPAQRLAQQTAMLGRALQGLYHLCDYLGVYAEICLHRQQYARAYELAEESLQIAQQIGRQDVQLAARLFSMRAQVALEQLPKPAAMDNLRALLSTYQEEHEQAMIWYEIWRLDGTQEEARRQAADLYQRLYRQKPHATYRRRYQKVTANSLSELPPLPPLPADFAARAPDIETLLPRVEEMIADVEA